MAILRLIKIAPETTYQDNIDRAKRAGLKFSNVIVNTEGGQIDFFDAEYEGESIKPSSAYDPEPHPFAARFYPNPDGGFATIYPLDPVRPPNRAPAPEGTALPLGHVVDELSIADISIAPVLASLYCLDIYKK